MMNVSGSGLVSDKSEFNVQVKIRLFGDVNDDGKVDSTDYNLLIYLSLIHIFTTDMNIVFTFKKCFGPTEPTPNPTEPTEPTRPTEPTAPTDPTRPPEPTAPTDPCLLYTSRCV